MGKTQILAIVGFCILFSYTNCSEVAFQTDTQSSLKLCEAGDECVITCKGADCADNTHLKVFEKEVPLNNSTVDIIFVIDNSHSMKNELALLGSKFQDLADSLGPRDWQACLITTDYENEKGHPRKWADNSYLLSKSTVDFQTVFETSLDEIVPETNNAANFEQGIRSANALIESMGLAKAQDCLRTDAAKAFIFVSDEDELGEGWVRGALSPLQPTPANYPEALLALASAKFDSELSLSIHAVAIKPDDNVCLQQQRTESGTYEASMGYPAVRYSQLVTQTRGELIDICSDDYSQALNKLGENIAESMESFDLPCESQAAVNKVEFTAHTTTHHHFTVIGKKIRFSPALEPGEKVKVHYACL